MAKNTAKNTATDLSVVLSDLQALDNKIKQFQSLPCFDLLLRISTNLTISLFIPTKDNTNPLNGKRDLFVASKYDHDLSVVSLPTLPDLDTMIAEHNGIDVLDVTVRLKNAFLDSDTGKQYLDCKAILNNLQKIDLSVLTIQYKNYQRVQSFLADTDPSMFDIPIWDREFVDDLASVSKEIKDLFVGSHKLAFVHDPTITKVVVRKGVIESKTLLHQFDQTVANFDSYSGILQILAKLKEYGASKKDASFFRNGINQFIAQYTKRPDFDAFILYLFLRKFDSNLGSKQNVDQTSQSFKDLY